MELQNKRLDTGKDALRVSSSYLHCKGSAFQMTRGICPGSRSF